MAIPVINILYSDNLFRYTGIEKYKLSFTDNKHPTEW